MFQKTSEGRTKGAWELHAALVTVVENHCSRFGSWSSTLKKRCRQSSTSTTRIVNVSSKSPTTTKACLPFSSSKPRSNVGQEADALPTPRRVTSLKAEFTLRTLEAACWPGLGFCWPGLGKQRCERPPWPLSI